jgi:hypothetical protein
MGQVVWIEALDDEGPFLEAAGLEPGEDRREIDHPGPRRDVDVLGRLEILDGHSHNQPVDARGVVHRVELAVGVIEDVAGVVPDAEVLVPHELDRLAALRAGGVEPAVRLDADPHALFGRVVAALGDRLVVGLVELGIADAAHEQIHRPACGAVVDQSPEPFDAGFEGFPDRNIAPVHRDHLEIAFLDLFGDPARFVRRGRDGDHQSRRGLRRHQADVAIPRLGDRVQRHAIVVLRPRPCVTADQIGRAHV